jgi:hypothetical protein
MSKRSDPRTVKAVVAGSLVFGVFRGRSNKPVVSQDRITAIINARIFDGERVIEDTTMVIKGAYIQSVGGEVPAGQLSSMATAQA